MITLIACVDMNNAIGKNNKLLSRQEDDLKHFKESTTGKYIVMGKNTWESIGRKALPNRKNVILSKTMELGKRKDYVVVDDVMDIVELSNYDHIDEVMIIGGQHVYESFLPHADKIYLTVLYNTFEADTFFPEISNDDWHLESETKVFPSDENNEYPYQYKVYTRK